MKLLHLAVLGAVVSMGVVVGCRIEEGPAQGPGTPTATTTTTGTPTALPPATTATATDTATATAPSATTSTAPSASASGSSSATSGDDAGAPRAECDAKQCGPRLGMPNRTCPDGVHMSGPTGKCLKNADGTCGWEILACPK